MEKYSEEAMEKAIEQSKYNMKNDYQAGGPFGAVIVKDGKIISEAHNTVVESCDATAHAEINAIRIASKKLKTHDLEGCVLYTSAEPCPMCLSAIIWANIKEVYYANTSDDADKIGFRDDKIYDYLEGNSKKMLNLHHIKSQEAKAVFNTFQAIDDKEMY